ncbi:MAG: PD-(D/E)XK nuclease family protein, partial [Acidobacteriota bacterium]
CDLTLTLSDSREADEVRRFAMQIGAEDRLLPGTARKPRTTIVAASSPEREADEIARRILGARESGVQFREIGIALREASSYLPLLQGTLERFGIPARFYFHAPLRRHPAAVFLGGLIHCVLTGWEFGAALETLQAHPGWGSGGAFDRFDFRVREAMPGAGAPALLALCEEDFAKRIGPCLALDGWRGELARPRDWAHRLEQMAVRLYRPGRMEPARDHKALATARSHAAALSAWVEGVSSATGFWTDAEQLVSLDDFWRVAQEAMESASLHIPDDRRDVVHVMNVYEARQWDVSTLFVCGVTDRDFPKRNPQNLLFPDSDIDALRKAGIALRKAADQDREEATLWEALKSRAQDTLVLTYPEHDAGGRSAHSSRYLAELGPGIERPRLSRATPAVTMQNAGLAGHIEPREMPGALAAQHQRISLTALEDLAQCRFKFFAGRTLGLRPRPERPQERLQPKITGLILHEALEAWLNNKRQGDFVELFETAFDKMCREKHLPPGYWLEVERINLRAIARKVSATEQWTPVSSEAEVELTLDFPGGITVACRVDRIDRMSDTDCIIVDYKSSRTARVEQMAESQVKLQGPLYALAVREGLHLNTMAMMYLAVREDKRFGWGEAPGVDLGLKPIPPNWIEDARNRSIERISSFLGGEVYAEPAEPENCRWCDYQHACRVEQRQALVMIEGAQGD